MKFNFGALLKSVIANGLPLLNKALYQGERVTSKDYFSAITGAVVGYVSLTQTQQNLEQHAMFIETSVEEATTTVTEEKLHRLL